MVNESVESPGEGSTGEIESGRDVNSRTEPGLGTPLRAEMSKTAATNPSVAVVLPRPVAPARGVPPSSVPPLPEDLGEENVKRANEEQERAKRANEQQEKAKRANEEQEKAKRANNEEQEKAKRLEAARKRRKASRWKPLYFVVGTLVAWWALAVLADVVITCTPGGAPCRVPQLIVAAGRHVEAISNCIYERRDCTIDISGAASTSDGHSADAGQTRPTPPGTVRWGNYERWLFIVSLLAALWVVKAWVYPRTDETEEFTEEQLDGKT